jgi:DNA modification methylase
MNDLQVHWWPIDKVIPYARNSRKISRRAVDKVAASIREFGWRQPIVVDKDGVIIIGHVRRLAAKKLNLTEIPVHVAENLTPGQVKALRIMDNRSHEETDWDIDLLGPELEDLLSLDFDLELTGFDPNEIEDFLADPDLDQRANATPPLPDSPVTKPGDIWLCGKHRVLCGNSTTSDAVSRACGRTKPFLMATDPPYGVEYDPMWREEAGLGQQRQTGKVANDDQVDWTAAYKLFGGDVSYVWHAGVHAGEVETHLVAAGFEIRAQIIWSKQHFAMSRGHYHWQHEPCWYAVRKGRRSNWCGDRAQSTIWAVQNLNPMGGDRNEKATGHGTQKPVELMRRPILNHTKRGEVVYDPFLGSGTTMMAAELTDRICYGIDIDPRYVDVAVLRWQDYTGKEAKLEGDGRTFDQIKATRLGVAA